MKKAIGASLAFLILGFGVFWQVLPASFLGDDYLLLNAFERNPLWPWAIPQGDNFIRPLNYSSIGLEYAIWGLRPIPYHVTNVLLHIGCALLVCAVARRLLTLDGRRGNAEAISIGAGAIFLLLPCHAGAVGWISTRADLFTTLFSLLSLMLLLEFARARRRAHLVLSVLAFGAALMCKEASLILPLIVFLWTWGLLAEGRHRDRLILALRLTTPYALVWPIYLLWRHAALGTIVGGYGTSAHLQTAPSLLGGNLWNFCVHVLFSHLPLPARAEGLALILVGAAALIAITRTRETWRPIVVLALSFPVALIPVLNLGVVRADSQREHFLYLPSVFAVLLLVFIVRGAIRGTRLRAALLVGLALVYGGALYRTNVTWRQAGDMAKSVISSGLAMEGHDGLLVLNAPDTLRSAPLFRSGLSQGMKLWRHGRCPDPIVLTTHNLAAANEQVRVERNGSSFTVKLWHCGYTWGKPLLDVGQSQTGPLAKITSLSGSEREIELLEASGRTVVFFSEGRLLPAPPASEK